MVLGVHSMQAAKHNRVTSAATGGVEASTSAIDEFFSKRLNDLGPSLWSVILKHLDQLQQDEHRTAMLSACLLASKELNALCLATWPASHWTIRWEAVGDAPCGPAVGNRSTRKSVGDLERLLAKLDKAGREAQALALGPDWVRGHAVGGFNTQPAAMVEGNSANQPPINQPPINQPPINQPPINQPPINQPRATAGGGIFVNQPNQQLASEGGMVVNQSAAATGGSSFIYQPAGGSNVVIQPAAAGGDSNYQPAAVQLRNSLGHPAVNNLIERAGLDIDTSRSGHDTLTGLTIGAKWQLRVSLTINQHLPFCRNATDWAGLAAHVVHLHIELPSECAIWHNWNDNKIFDNFRNVRSLILLTSESWEPAELTYSLNLPHCWNFGTGLSTTALQPWARVLTLYLTPESFETLNPEQYPNAVVTEIKPVEGDYLMLDILPAAPPNTRVLLLSYCDFHLDMLSQLGRLHANVQLLACGITAAEWLEEDLHLSGQHPGIQQLFLDISDCQNFEEGVDSREIMQACIQSPLTKFLQVLPKLQVVMLVVEWPGIVDLDAHHMLHVVPAFPALQNKLETLVVTFNVDCSQRVVGEGMVTEHVVAGDEDMHIIEEAHVAHVAHVDVLVPDAGDPAGAVNAGGHVPDAGGPLNAQDHVPHVAHGQGVLLHMPHVPHDQGVLLHMPHVPHDQGVLLHMPHVAHVAEGHVPHPGGPAGPVDVLLHMAHAAHVAEGHVPNAHAPAGPVHFGAHAPHLPQASTIADQHAADAHLPDLLSMSFTHGHAPDGLPPSTSPAQDTCLEGEGGQHAGEPPFPDQHPMSGYDPLPKSHEQDPDERPFLQSFSAHLRTEASRLVAAGACSNVLVDVVLTRNEESRCLEVFKHGFESEAQKEVVSLKSSEFDLQDAAFRDYVFKLVGKQYDIEVLYF